MAIKLRHITAEDFDAVMRLQLADEQEGLVAPNMVSLAEERFRPNLESHAIYADHELVGYVLHGTWQGPAMVFRIMIDRRHQRKGYGTEAMQLLFRLYSEVYGFDALALSVSKVNAAARDWYISLGFETTDRRHFGEEVLEKKLV